MIESYAFGSIVVDGRKFTSDLIIYPDGHIDTFWWAIDLQAMISINL